MSRIGAQLTLSWPDEPAWNALMKPIAHEVERVARALGCEGDWQLVDGVARRAGELGLELASIDETVDLPEELRPLALDRWRRAAARALVGILTGPGADWRARAEALEAVDRAAPELGVLWEALASWWVEPELGIAERPDRGAWVVRWARAYGPADRWVPTEFEWLAFASWLFERGGPAAFAPIPLTAEAKSPGPWHAAPHSLRRVRVEPQAVGANIEVEGVVGPLPQVIGDTTTLVYATVSGGPCAVRVHAIAPVGTWVLRSGRRGERFGAARGIELTLTPDGRGEVTLADAFIGPATGGALELASQFGVSGVLYGTWRLVGADGEELTIQLGEVQPAGITVHPKGRRGFAMPAGALLGKAEGWLSQIGGTRWVVRPLDGGIEATGDDLGPTVVLRFARAD